MEYMTIKISENIINYLHAYMTKKKLLIFYFQKQQVKFLN